MSHLRQQIREAIAAKVTGLATTGARVYQSRVYPLSDSNLPCILVSTTSEEILGQSEGNAVGNVPRLTQRMLDISVKAVCKLSSNMDDQLDTICKEVEYALAPDRFLNNGIQDLTEDLALTATAIDLSGDAEQPLGVAEMNWKAIYWCNNTTPDLKG